MSQLKGAKQEESPLIRPFCSVGWGPPALGRAIGFTQSTNSSRITFLDKPKIKFDQMSGYHMVQSSSHGWWHLPCPLSHWFTATSSLETKKKREKESNWPIHNNNGSKSHSFPGYWYSGILDTCSLSVIKTLQLGRIRPILQIRNLKIREGFIILHPYSFQVFISLLYLVHISDHLVPITGWESGNGFSLVEWNQTSLYQRC